jgi:hypothetical protein
MHSKMWMTKQETAFKTSETFSYSTEKVGQFAIHDMILNKINYFSQFYLLIIK